MTIDELWKTDSIDRCIYLHEEEYPKGTFLVSDAKEQMQELKDRFTGLLEQLAQADNVNAGNLQRITELEEQLNDAREREHYCGTDCPHDYAKQIQQAEKRGYELARLICAKCFSNDPCPTSVDDLTYEQAIAERDGLACPERKTCRADCQTCERMVGFYKGSIK